MTHLRDRWTFRDGLWSVKLHSNEGEGAPVGTLWGKMCDDPNTGEEDFYVIAWRAEKISTDSSGPIEPGYLGMTPKEAKTLRKIDANRAPKAVRTKAVEWQLAYVKGDLSAYNPRAD